MHTGLHSRDLTKLFKAQFKKYPYLEDIYNNIENTSEEHIEQLGCRPWIKKHLKKLKNRRTRGLDRNDEALEIATKLANKMRLMSE